MADQFIDPESDFVGDKNNYEEIVISQIKETAKILSQDLTIVIIQNKDSGMSYKEDKRKIAINHIITLRSLMNPFLKKPELDKLKIIDENFKKYLEEYGNKTTLIKGKGYIAFKNLIHNPQSIPYNQLMEKKIDVSREIFDLLVISYKKNKDEIASFSVE